MTEIDQLLTSFYLFLGWQPYTWFALFVLVNVLDAVTTVKALSLGGREANPLMRLAMQMFGVVPAVALLKCAVFYAVFTHLGTIILYMPLLVMVYVGVVAWNLRQIARLKARA